MDEPHSSSSLPKCSLGNSPKQRGRMAGSGAPIGGHIFKNCNYYTRCVTACSSFSNVPKGAPLQMTTRQYPQSEEGSSEFTLELKTSAAVSNATSDLAAWIIV